MELCTYLINNEYRDECTKPRRSGFRYSIGLQRQGSARTMLPRDTTGDTRNPSWSTRNKCVARAVRIRTYRPAVDLLYEIANTRDETRAEMRRDCDCDSEDGCRLLTRISSEGGGAGGRARHVAMVRDQATCTRPMAARAPRIAPRPRTAPPRARHRPCTAHGAVPTA